ncbi:MAG TPA: acyl-CoA dehydrogenase family protein [Dehalococcoidia bacterium]|nr:acyl-CoA dehydrogenase family protein [Dehalococcoidia bacterium]
MTAMTVSILSAHKTAPESPARPIAFARLQARTGAGANLVRIAEALAPQFAERALEHDRDGSYPFEAIASLKEAGYFLAPFDGSLGGLGVVSVHDLAVASSRLAQGDPSVAIGVNMHLSVAGNLARRWRMAKASGNERRLQIMTSTIRSIVEDATVIATATSEPGQDLGRPSTTATRVENGWLINGRKIFGTMSPAADLFFVSVGFPDADGNQMFGYVRVPAAAPGLTILNDWDALGMRASGSHGLRLENVLVPGNALPGGFPAGRLTSGYIEGNLTAGLYHAAASLGIAESAHALAVDSLARKRDRGSDSRPSEITDIAANSIDLSAMRASLSRAGDLIDDAFARYPASDVPFEDAVCLFAEVQASKAFVNRTAQAVVDRALALSGGAGFMSGHPLSRAYRDVRAGAFMHPLGANRALEFLAEAALGDVPALR